MAKPSKPEIKFALSIYPWWAWLIIRPDLKTEKERDEALAEGLFKNIDNREYNSKYTGHLGIHASQMMDAAKYQEAVDFLTARSIPITLPPIDKLQRGGILGSVNMLGTTHSSLSRWFTGPVGFVFDQPKIVPFRKLAGKLNIFAV